MNFCTYFDTNYAYKGWVCHHTLSVFLDNFSLYVLCLDNSVYDQAKTKKNVIPILLSDIENEFPELLEIKHTRLAKEYYATMTAFLALYIFNKYNIETLFYTDADMAFWSNPLNILKTFDSKSILVTEHGFGDSPRAGVFYNVGILGYRNDQNCRKFLEWWGQKCIDWCYWRTEENGFKCGDQGYLNIFKTNPEMFSNFISLEPQKCGINVGPWNGGMVDIKLVNNVPKLNGNIDLICYHYHEFSLTEKGYYPTGWKLNDGFIQHVYNPYYIFINKYFSNTL